ncbi:hypothetical protein EDB35_15512 [Vibrio crassostreae]|nr:hypothetical protein EDB35_15512 [Vibrio crassostreae]
MLTFFVKSEKSDNKHYIFWVKYEFKVFKKKVSN